MGRDRIIEAYIQRLLSWDQPLTNTTVTAIAKDVGITKGELDAISIHAKAYLTRGNAYIKFGDFDRAIHAFNQSASLDPLNLDLLHVLASAYHQRYKHNKNRADHQNALLVARRCVELNPDDQEALELISFLRHTPAKSRQREAQWRRQKLAFVASGIAILGLSIIGLSRLPLFSNPPDPIGASPDTIVSGADVDNANHEQVVDDSSSSVQIDLAATGKIPVVFSHPGLVMEARSSELGEYGDESYYQLQGVFINAGDQEFKNLVVNVQFLDRNGGAIAATDNEAISDQDAIIRPGDTHPFNLLQKITPGLATIRLSVTSLQPAPAPKTYVPPTPINYSWPGLEPEDISFELAGRSETFRVTGTLAGNTESTNSNDDQKNSKPSSRSAVFNAEWVVINTSDAPLSKLQLQVDFYSANDRLLQSEDVVVIRNNDAPMLQGETRPFRVVKPIARGYERYKVTVIEAE